MLDQLNGETMRWRDIVEFIDFDELADLKMPGSMQRMLNDQGYRFLARGAGGAVFDKPGSPNVVKVGKLNDGWWEWINWAKSNQYDCVLKVVNVRKYNDALYMATIEKLKPVPDSFTKTKTWLGYCAWMYLYTSDDTFKEIYLRRATDEQIKQLADDFASEQPCLPNVLKHLVDSFKHYHLDLYGVENFMFRENQLVVTDPLSRKK